MMFNLFTNEFYRDLPGSFTVLQFIKNPWARYSVKANTLQQQFYLRVEFSDSKQAVKMISETLDALDFVSKKEGKPVKVIIDSFIENRVKLLVTFWFDTCSVKSVAPGTRSGIMLEIMVKLGQAGIRFSG